MIGTPSPRNDSVASSAMADAICSVATTTSGGRQLGSRCRNTMRDVDSPEPASGFDVVLLPLDQRRRADGARVVGPLHGDQRDHDVAETGMQEREQDQRDQDRRERQLQVRDPHDHRVDAAAGVARDEAERDADDGRDDGRHDTDRDADAQAEDDGRQHVAALAVGAEQVVQRAFAPGSPAREPGGSEASRMSSFARSYGFCGTIHGASSAATTNTREQHGAERARRGSRRTHRRPRSAAGRRRPASSRPGSSTVTPHLRAARADRAASTRCRPRG